MRRDVTRSIGPVTAVLGLLAAAAMVALPAAPSAAQTTSYTGAATGNLVGLTAATIPGTLQVGAISVAPSTAQVDSSGGLAAAPGASSYAKAENLDADLLNDGVKLDNLVVEADQSAPPDNATPTTKTLATVPADPVADATVTTATADARWLGADSCLPVGTDIARGTSTAATANVLTGTGLGSAVVSVVNSSGGPVTSTSSVALMAGSGPSAEGLQATQLDQLTGIILFKGSASEVDINVSTPPEIVATATGVPGGASVTYTEPVLTVTMGGTTIGTLDAAKADTSLTIPGLITLSLGQLTKTVATDGTSASGSANLLNVGINLGPLSVANLTVAGASAAASVPAGGVDCSSQNTPNPLGESHKDASSSAVAPGSPFDYTITVPNRGTCTLTDVTVTDTITAPAGTRITSVPAPTSTADGGLTLTWDLGQLSPNQTTNIPVTVTTPADTPAGFAFRDSGSVTGQCNGTSYTQPISLSGPSTFTPTVGSCHLDESTVSSDHSQVLPGETFDYDVHLLNDGTAPCTDIVVTDALGGGVTFVGATDGGTESGSTVTWNVPTLAPGGSMTLVAEVSANRSDTPGTTLPTTVTIVPTQEPNGVKASTGGPTVSTVSQLAPSDPPTPVGGAQPGTAAGADRSGNGSGSGAAADPAADPAGDPPAVTTAAGATGAELPFTGGQPLAPYGLGLLVVGVVGWAVRRRFFAAA
jgi:uncharacterized repeat protein (TIGR01451 family)